MMHETQATIAAWIKKTFGSAPNIRTATRANEEMAELLKAVAANDSDPKAGEEVADIVICLIRIVDNLGLDLQEEIDKKMSKNRARKWALDGTGCGYHVPDPTP